MERETAPRENKENVRNVDYKDNREYIRIQKELDNVRCVDAMCYIHKSQGSTLDRAEIDVSEAFAPGQVYVALSRVRSLASLKIKSFSPYKIKVNKKCFDFYNLPEEEKDIDFLIDDDE